jgi:hypothetical protein
MNWKNLLKDKCPKCGKNIRFLLVERIWECQSRKPKCDFFISDIKKNEIGAEMIGIPERDRLAGIAPANPSVIKHKINQMHDRPWASYDQ